MEKIKLNENEYNIQNIVDIIELSEKYQSGRKRPRGKMKYNLDLERLKDCIGPLKKLNELIGMEDIKKKYNRPNFILYSGIKY